MSMTDGEGGSQPSSDSEGSPRSGPTHAASSATLSGATGKFFAAELAKLLQDRSAATRHDSSSGSSWNPWEQVELGVAVVYDRPFSAFFNFLYDVLHLSSGRDKFCALIQGYAKFASAALCRPDSERYWMYRAIEDNFSDGRKIFRLFKEFREVYKVRRGLNRLIEGVSEGGCVSIPAVCGFLDTCGHICSFCYYLFDNLLWAASVGLVRSKEVPKWQVKMWQGFRRNGPIISRLGGVAKVKRHKNLASIWRLFFGFIANSLLLIRALENCAARNGGKLQGLDDARLFHTLELIGMAANFRILWSKLGYTRLSHEKLGLLAMLAAAEGIWINWRKVTRKKCGSKDFATDVERRKLLSSGHLRRLKSE